MKTVTDSKIVVCLKEYLQHQLADMLGPANVQYTVENLHLNRPPTREELIENYIKYGGAEHFAKVYTQEKAATAPGGADEKSGEKASEAEQLEEKKDY